MTAAGAQGLRVAHLDTGRDWRGGQAQVLLLMEGLRRRGVSNLLLAPEAPLLDRARERGIAVRVWRPRGDLDLPALGRARRALAEWRAEIVHCHDARAHALGVPAARWAGVRVVVVSRRVAVAVARGPWSALKYRMPVDRYLCVSRGVIEAMRVAGVPQEKLVRVPSGVAPPPAVPVPGLRALAGIPESAPVVATVAALTPEKRHGDLLAAALRVIGELPQVHFVWLGEGPLRRELESERDRLGLAGVVHLLGFRADAAALVRGATVVALASDLEGIATSLIEAQAVGIPVVATRVGGIPEVVEDGISGRLVPPRDPRALAGALIELLTDPERARAMGARGVEGAGEFHIDRTVDRTLEEYLALIGRAPRAA